MSWKTPKKEDYTPLGPGVCSKGWHSFSIADAEATKSKSSGNLMMVLKYICDAGPDSGSEVVDRIVFTEDGDFGERKSRTVADAAQFDWDEDVETFEDWVAEWLVYPALRLDILVDHEYTTGSGPEGQETWKNNVTKEEWDAHDGRKFTKAIPKQFRPVTLSAEIDTNLHLVQSSETGNDAPF